MARPSQDGAIEQFFAEPPPIYQFGATRYDLGEGARAMQAVAVAGGDLGVDPSQTSILAWLGGIITAGLGALGIWLAQRTLGKAAFQTAINEGFNKLTDNLQEERDKERAERVADRKAWTEERATLQGEIRNLMQTIESLKAELRRHGLPIPEGRHPAPETGAEIHPLEPKL